MKSIKNEKLIKRNATIGQWSSLIALVVLGIGMYLTFAQPQLFSYSLGALAAGFLLSQVGMYFGNRWGRSPRPDEKIDAGLKGLPGDFTVYHYVAPTPHLLVSPAGLWVIMHYHQRGKMYYHKNRWRNSGGGLLQGYMRIFGQEGIGRPDLEAESEALSVKKFLSKHMEEGEIPEVNPLIVFTADDVEIDASDSPIPAMKPKQLKDYLRQKAKEKKIGPMTLEKIRGLFEE
ncbi:MAG: hypothetical protein AB1649_05010 [Chloroflexota bacterium]